MFSQNNFIGNKYFLLLMGMAVLFTFGMDAPFFYINWFAGVILIFCFFIKIYKGDINVKVNILPFTLLTFWVLFPLLFTFFATDIGLHLKYIIISVFYITVSYSLIKLLLNNKDNLLFFLLNVNVIWISISIITLVLFFLGIVTYDNGYFSGIFYNRNQFAVLTASLSGVLLYFLKEYDFKQRVVAIALVFFSLVLILISSSLKGLIIILLLIALYGFIRADRKQKISLVILAIITLVTIMVIDNPISERLNRFILVFSDPNQLKATESAYNRVWLIKESWGIVKENPFMGVGVNNSILMLFPPYLYFFDNTPDIGTYSHNNYLEMLLNGGFITLIIYYLPIVYVLVQSIKKLGINSRLNIVVALLFLKLIIDFAQVSYFDFGVIFFTVFGFLIYFFSNYQDGNLNRNT
ncbi:O-Antigen ligase [Mesobacillus persicus]|uniref:O-Antigen ligase n=1 Tax=Mesobacillus persicus TaxID=930146 RepID=A0A1H8A682_9BACI|nr:O-antigen ligase family protein [Mesobacillus persicus]SEM65996.1 O-Antigen ligase [Mesobacillus persicus]